MSTTAVERLMRDLKRLQQDAPPSDDDIMLWIAIIVGAFCQLFMFPANNIMAFDFFTVFSQALVGLFVTELLPLLVPFGLSSGCYKPPSLLNLIRQSQMPLHKLMLGDPHPYSPANQQAATMLIERRIDYYKKAQRIVELSCKAV